MTDNNLPPFSFPAVSRKQVTAAFDGGRLTSNGGVMLLAMADSAAWHSRESWRAVFPIAAIQRGSPIRSPTRTAARVFAISCGYEDADDLDRLRADPAFKLACGRLPESGADLCFAADAVAAGRTRLR